MVAPFLLLVFYSSLFFPILYIEHIICFLLVSFTALSTVIAGPFLILLVEKFIVVLTATPNPAYWLIVKYLSLNY